VAGIKNRFRIDIAATLLYRPSKRKKRRQQSQNLLPQRHPSASLRAGARRWGSTENVECMVERIAAKRPGWAWRSMKLRLRSIPADGRIFPLTAS